MISVDEGKVLISLAEMEQACHYVYRFCKSRNYLNYSLLGNAAVNG